MMKKKILIIDEENISIKGITYLLDTKVDRVDWSVCKTCGSGLKALKADTYDLLILDMMLPTGEWIVNIERPDNLYGIDLLEEIRNEFRALPIICYTIMSDNYIIDKIKRFGAVYLCKLWHNNREELVSQIKKLLSR